MEAEPNNVNHLNETTSQTTNFEKYKLKIELFKWFIGSVALVIMTTVIDFGFRDRAAGIAELQQYDKYVTELIVLNKEPGQKRMLAQFFAFVTPSKKLKQGWTDYYKEVDKEYQTYIAPILRSDSIARARYDQLIMVVDPDDIEQKEQINILKQQIDDNQRLINPDIILPERSSSNRNYESALDWEAKGFSFLFAKDVDNAILAFNNSENSYNGLHMVFEIQRYLRANRGKLLDQNSEEWKVIYATLANDYSWKMKPEVRKKLVELSK